MMEYLIRQEVSTSKMSYYLLPKVISIKLVVDFIEECVITSHIKICSFVELVRFEVLWHIDTFVEWMPSIALISYAVFTVFTTLLTVSINLCLLDMY